MICGVWLVALPVRDAEACSCFEISPYDSDSGPPVIATTSDLWVYVSPPDGATQVEAQVVLLREPRPNASTRLQVRDVLASSTEHGHRADRHIMRIHPSGRWPARGRLAVRERYQGRSISAGERQWQLVRSYRVGGGLIANAFAAWGLGTFGTMQTPQVSLLNAPSLQTSLAQLYGANLRGEAPFVVATSCGQVGPTLAVNLAANAAETVLVYVNRLPTGFPDSLTFTRAGLRGSPPSNPRLVITSGSSTCGSQVLQPGDLAAGTTLWLVPIGAAGERGEPVMVVVPQG